LTRSSVSNVARPRSLANSRPVAVWSGSIRKRTPNPAAAVTVKIVACYIKSPAIRRFALESLSTSGSSTLRNKDSPQT
jgi:hypothetical protein